MGSVDLGVKAQLAEIERGFFDRVGKREDVNQSPAQSTALGSTDQRRAEREVFQDRVMYPAVSRVQSESSQKTAMKAMDGQYLDELVLPSAAESQLNDAMGSDSHSDSYDAEWTNASSFESRTQSEAILQPVSAEVLS
jgi:hypothetical protein